MVSLFSSKYFSADFAEDYYANYADEFKSLNQSPKEMFERRTAPKAYTWIRKNYIKEYLGNNYKKLQTVIEVGCNDGCNLYPYHLDGKKVAGCDFDEQRNDKRKRIRKLNGHANDTNTNTKRKRKRNEPTRKRYQTK